MPSKKNKVSSNKVAKNKKPVKGLKPAGKTAANLRSGKPAKKSAKPVKSSKPAPKKKIGPKKVVKPVVKKTPPAKAASKKASASKSKAPVKAIKKGLAANKVKKAVIPAKAPVKSKAPDKKALKKAVDTKDAKKAVVKPKIDGNKAKINGQKVKMDGHASKNNGFKLEGKENNPVKSLPKLNINKEPEIEKTRKPTDPFAKKNYADRSVSDVLAISNTIPVKQKNEISASKIASISNSITNPVKKTDSYAVKPEKEPNGKFELEFVIHSSAEMLYEFLSTPSGLSEWFCDDLNIRNGIYTFIWDDQLQQARLLKTVDVQLVRFQWVDKTDGSYFEFRIQRDDLTNDISLIITDFADSVSDRESSKLLWHSQIEKLMHVIGSIF